MNANAVIHWMAHVGEGSWSAFKRAVASAVPPDDVRRAARLLRARFSDLGFAEFFVDGIQKLTGQNLWDPSVRVLTTLPSRTDPVEVFAIVSLALLFSFLATLYPAWKAASTDPVQVLRYE